MYKEYKEHSSSDYIFEILLNLLSGKKSFFLSHSLFYIVAVGCVQVLLCMPLTHATITHKCLVALWFLFSCEYSMKFLDNFMYMWLNGICVIGTGSLAGHHPIDIHIQQDYGTWTECLSVRIWQCLTYAMLDFGITNRLYVTVALNSNVFLTENRRKHEVSTDSLV